MGAHRWRSAAGARSQRRRVAAAVVGLCVLAGCGAQLPQPQYATITDEEPPSPLAEVLPAPSRPGKAWINGYWYYVGGSYVWLPGHWATHPGADYEWQRSGWVPVQGGYRFYPGRWVLHGHESPDYVHPAAERRQGETYQALTPAELEELMERMGPLPRVPSAAPGVAVPAPDPPAPPEPSPVPPADPPTPG